MQSKGVIDDVGRHLAQKWSREHPDAQQENPWSLKNIARIKSEFDGDENSTKQQYPELFYYYNGLLGTKISQSVHPAGIVISPITLDDNYGVFNKDGEDCLLLDMDNIHDYTGLVKYDFLILKTVQVVRDTYQYLNKPYPRMHEIDWNDDEVWDDMIRSPVGLFQMESGFAFDSLRKFRPRSIFDLSLVTACIRPSGESYRNDLLARKSHKNPSEIIDKMLEDNLGYCIEESQLVQTENGLEKIKDIKEGTLVETMAGYRRVYKKTYMGEKKTVCVRHKFGKLFCTEDHQILTDSGYKRACDLTGRDSIALFKGTSSKKPIDKNMLRIVGWLIGDGSLSVKRVIALINADMNVHLAFRKCVEEYDSDLTTSILDRTTRHGTPLYRSHIKYVTNCKKEKSIRKELKKYGLVFDNGGLRAEEKFVPSQFFSLGRESLLIFIGAYTDTDSTIGKDKAFLIYTTASKQLAMDLISILRMVSILAVMTEYPNDGYRIIVQDVKNALLLLYDYSIKVRRIFESKEALLAHRSVGSNGDVCRRKVVDAVEQMGYSKKKICKRTGVSLYSKQERIRVDTVTRLNDEFPTEYVKFISNPRLAWSRIYSIDKHADKTPVYDLSIEEEHNFVCEGVVVHNCVYQEDSIRFLQEICGLSGSEADTVRRGVARKKKDILDAAMPSILEGYCEKSDKPREVAEQEAKEFLQIIEDSASYQFGYNHSIAYCLLTYLCAYCRHYYPIEFLTSFLNNAANDDDIKNGTAYASKVGIKVTMPKWGLSKSEYFYDKEKGIIAKGLSSVKFMSKSTAEQMYRLSHRQNYARFTDILLAVEQTAINTRQIDILIKLDFFSEFGNQRELLRIADMFYGFFNHGNAKQIGKDKVAGTPLEEIIQRHSTGTTKAGAEAKRYTIQDMPGLLRDTEDAILALHLDDLSDVLKVQNFADAMGYAGYVSGREEDRRKLYITGVFPLIRKRDGKQFGYSVLTKSIGSGIEARWTVFNRVFDLNPVKTGDIILCKSWERDGKYFIMNSYERVC